MAVFGLIGFPLSHSFSKNYFNERFAAEGLPHTFENFPLKDISEFHGLLKQDISGLAVTIPYKTAVIPYLDELSEEARAIGAVNCITIQNGTTRGHNTDAAGFEKSILPLLQGHGAALVLGNGGASKAVQYVLKKNNIPHLVVCRERVEGCISYGEADPFIVRHHTLIINTTPLGMYPDIYSKPQLPYEAITSDHLLYDLVYNPEFTAFLMEGRKRGARTRNGLEMLYNQAEENWRLWSGMKGIDEGLR